MKYYFHRPLPLFISHPFLHSHRLSLLFSIQLMVVFLFILSLLTVISCDNTHQSPCDSSFKLTMCSTSNCNLVYNLDHSFACPNNDSFIFTPFVDTAELIYKDKSYKIELFSIKCNATTNKWEAEDRFRTNDPTKFIQSKRNIFAAGYLDCTADLQAAEPFKMSCSETRLDYHENLDDRGAVVPNYNKNSKTYSCNDKEHKFFYSPKITIHPREGFYLTESPVCNKDSILTAKFTTNEKPLNISYLGSISCKKFTCSDSNDAPYTWPFIIGMDFDCNSHADCRTPNWHNEKAPCGDGGHELAILRNNEWIWLKDQYFQCGVNDEILYVDSSGMSERERGLQTKSDKIVCKLPPSCEPLMSDPQSTYGCLNRSNCNPIDPSLIVSSHLSSFDGRCYQREHTLKIVTEPTSSGMAPEIDFVSCQFGKWIVTLAENSQVNQAFNVEDLAVDKRTNFVCEGRVDFSQCNDPISNCDGEKRSSVGNMCKQAKKNDNDDTLFCDAGFELVLRAKYENGEENIERVDSKVICDRRSGKWISTKYPFIEERSGINEKGIRWESSFVCAKESCTDDFKSFCTTEVTDKGRPKLTCHNVSNPKYWLDAACSHPFQLYYSENNHRAPSRIEKLHCDYSNGKLSWKFYEIDGTEPIEAAEMDTFSCQEEQPKKSRVRVKQMDDTSPECNPSRLDTICQFQLEFCTPVEKRKEGNEERGETIVTSWYCQENTNLFYYEAGKEEKIELANLSCSSNEIFWKAYRMIPIDTKIAYFTPPPHSNIVCLSNGNNTKDENGNRKEKSMRPNKKGKRDRIKKVWRWHLSAFESIALFTSLLIFVLSATLFVWARRKYYKGKRSEHSVEDH